MEQTITYSYWKNAWKQFKFNKPAIVSIYIIGAFLFVGFLSPIIANEKPLYVRYQQQNFFPAFSFSKYYELKNANGLTEKIQLDLIEWKQIKATSIIWPLVPYSPFASDLLNSNFKSPTDEQFIKNEEGIISKLPFRFRHWLGTGSRGEDVLSGLIHGARISMTIGFLSMAIASLIGLFLGSMAGFFGDNNLTITKGKFWWLIIGIALAWNYAFTVRTFALESAISTSGFSLLFQLLISIAIFSCIIFIFSKTGNFFSKIPVLKNKMFVPVDFLISRCIEILHSLPIFILVITVATVAKPSFINLMIIIGLTSWTGIARLTRSEFLRIRQMEYIQASKALGFSQWRIIFKHALPNALAPALVSIAFGVASAILTESSLSFLGVGVPVDVQTWGKMLSTGKSDFNAWWLVIFPGLMIFVSVVCYNLIGEGLREALDPKQKK